MKRIAVISHVWYKDYAYMGEQFDRLGELYGDVALIHGGEPLRYGMFIVDYCKKHDGFTEVAVPKSARKYGAGPGGLEQAWKMLDAEPDEVWKFETSPGSRRRPDHAIFPEFWALAADRGIPCRRFYWQKRKTPYKEYMESPQTDATGFPVPVRIREWDADRSGLKVHGSGVQRHSATPDGRRQLRERRAGRYRQ